MTTAQQDYFSRQEIGSTTVNGLDYQQGNMIALASLSPFYGMTTNQSAGIYYVPASNKIVVKQNGATLNGYNFSGVSVQINANDVTIENCTFNDQNALFTVRQMAGFSGMTVQNCTFNGGDNVALAGFVQSDTGYATVSNNTFIDTPSHAVQIPDGVVSDNSFFGAGFQTGCHADAICVENSTGPVLIAGNYVDWTNTYGGVVATNNAIRITTDIGNVSNVTVTKNVLLGGQDTVAVVYGSGAYGPGVFSNVNISNNYIGDYVYSAYYPQDPSGVTLGAYTDVGFDNPALSAAAWSAYQDNSIQVNSLVTATASQPTISAPSSGSSMLYGAGLGSARLGGGAGETIFIGGAGAQNFWGGTGKNIFTYLAVADSTTQSPDYIGNFNVASDVIDLHALNADPAGAFANFTFIGSAPFSSAGGEIQVTQNVARNYTLVEADLVGDSGADFVIRLGGVLNLTAANFALTTAQYETAISAATTVASFQASQASLDQVAGGFSVIDTVANVQSDSAALQADASNINGITLLGGVMTVNVAAMTADQPLLDKIAGGFNVADTAANLQSNLPALEADIGNIGAVTATGGTMSISAATFLANAPILAESAVDLDIADTSANLQANLIALQADTANIDSLTATSGVITVNAAIFVADQALLDKAAGGFAVSDTVANIQANLAALNADAADITATTATDGTVSVNLSNFAAYQPGLNDIVGGFNVTDVVTNVQANLAALQADSTHIGAITAQYGSVSASVVNFTADKAALNKIVGGFNVSDTVANIQANLAVLNADAANIISTTATSGMVTVNVGGFAAYQPALNDLVAGFAVTDTIANVQANLDALNADAPEIASITATGGTMSISTATFLADEAALNKTAVTTLSVTDTSANLQANLAALQADAAVVDALTATGGAITVNVATFLADQTVLNKAVGGFAVVDTGANVQANLAALSADAARITSTTATGGTVSVNVSGFAADKAGLNDIVGGFNVTDVVTNVQANLAALQADSANIEAIAAQYGSVSASVANFKADKAALNEIVGGFKISDTAAMIQSSLGALNADAAHIVSATATGGVVTANVAIFVANRTALNDIFGGFDVVDTVANIQSGLASLEADVGNIDAVAATGGTMSLAASTFLADKPVLDKTAVTLNIADTAANLQANLMALQADVANIDSITATSGVVTVNTAAFAADQTLLNKAVGGFNVADTVALIQANLAPLQADAGHIGAITASGGTVSVSATTFVADQTALNEITGGFDIADASTNLQPNLAALLADAAHIDAITSLYGAFNTSVATLTADEALLNKVVGGVKIIDAGANIQANLAFLQSDVANIGAIQLSSGTVLVSALAFLADQTVLNKIASGFAVVDTSANIQAQIAALQSDAAGVTSVTLSDSTTAAPAVLTLTAANAISDAAILAKIVSPYVLDTTANATTSVTGHGNGLTIAVGAGDSVVTGGGLNETLNVGSNFGSMQIADFATHYSDPSHDTISLSTADFGNWTTLVSEGHSSGAGNANTTFTAADGASLTINGTALSSFQHPGTSLQADFTFHA